MAEDIAVFAAVGFAAQMIDGAIGMAYGLSATGVLLALGVAPATASAGVHAAEVFTTGASGLARIGAWATCAAAWCCAWRCPTRSAASSAPTCRSGRRPVGTPTGAVRVFVGAYLLVLGGVILLKALRPRSPLAALPTAQVGALGFCGGVLDAIGGGGWGAIVTSTLIGPGSVPREAIGSASLAEFFVTAAISAAFVATVGVTLWPIVAGLVLGGVLAAPLAAPAARRVPERPLMAVVGIVVSLPALRGLLAALGAPAGAS